MTVATAADAEVGIRDHEPYLGQAAGTQRAQELRPEGAVFAVADRQAQYVALASDGHAHGDHDNPRRHGAADAALEVGGVEEHVGERDVRQRPGTECLQRLVEL